MCGISSMNSSDIVAMVMAVCVAVTIIFVASLIHSNIVQIEKMHVEAGETEVWVDGHRAWKRECK